MLCRPLHVSPTAHLPLCRFYGLDPKAMEAKILERQYDGVTLNYEMLLLRQQKGGVIRLPANKAHMDPAAAMKLMQMSAKTKSAHRLSVEGTPGPASGSIPASMGVKAVAHHMISKGGTRLDLGDPVPLSKEHRSNSVGMGASNGVTSLAGLGDEDGKGSLGVQGRREGYGSHADNINSAGASKPKSKSLFGSLGSLFGSRESLMQPRKVKALFNVKTTSTKTPDAVRAEVLRVVSEPDTGYGMPRGTLAHCALLRVDIAYLFVDTRCERRVT